MTIEFRCEKVPWHSGIGVYVCNLETHSLALPMQWQKVEEGAAFAEPTFRIRVDEAQQIMDELWRCGLRPSEGTGSAGSLAATERHLDDMRRLVFGDNTKHMSFRP